MLYRILWTEHMYNTKVLRKMEVKKDVYTQKDKVVISEIYNENKGLGELDIQMAYWNEAERKNK